MMLHFRFTSLPIRLCLLAGLTLVLSQLGCYASNHYSLGLNYAIAGDYERAIVEYSKAIDVNEALRLDTYDFKGIGFAYDNRWIVKAVSIF